MIFPRKVPVLISIFILLVQSLSASAAPAAGRKKKKKAASGPTALAVQETGNFSAVDALVQQQIGEQAITGAVLLVGHDGRIVHQKAFGMRATTPKAEPMTVDTVFDLASLTKVVATTPS